MIPTRRTTWRAAASAAAAGLALGLVVRLIAAAAEAPERATLVLTAWFAAACVAGGIVGARLGTRTETLRTVALLVGCVFVGGALASAVARPGLAGHAAACVPAACAALAALTSRTARVLRMDAAAAVFPGALLPLVLAGSIFVADPFIEWRGSRPASPDVARAFLVANPVVALTSVRGGAGYDWPAAKLMYDGPGRGSEGLSLIGQYYPSPPPSSAGWSAGVLLATSLLVLLPAPRAR